MEEGSNEKEKKLFDLEGYTTKHATYITHTHTYRKRKTAMERKKRDRESEIVVEQKKRNRGFLAGVAGRTESLAG
jgi:hypothetical protein